MSVSVDYFLIKYLLGKRNLQFWCNLNGIWRSGSSPKYWNTNLYFFACFYLFRVIQSHCICKIKLYFLVYNFVLAANFTVESRQCQCLSGDLDLGSKISHLLTSACSSECWRLSPRQAGSTHPRRPPHLSLSSQKLTWHCIGDVNIYSLTFKWSFYRRTDLVPTPWVWSTSGSPPELPDGVGIRISSMSVSLVSIIFIFTGSFLCLLFRSFPYNNARFARYLWLSSYLPSRLTLMSASWALYSVLPTLVPWIFSPGLTPPSHTLLSLSSCSRMFLSPCST